MKLSTFSHKKEFEYIMKYYLAPLVGIKLTDASFGEHSNDKKKLIQIEVALKK